MVIDDTVLFQYNYAEKPSFDNQRDLGSFLPVETISSDVMATYIPVPAYQDYGG
jgi:hypothetical protein